VCVCVFVWQWLRSSRSFAFAFAFAFAIRLKATIARGCLLASYRVLIIIHNTISRSITENFINKFNVIFKKINKTKTKVSVPLCVYFSACILYMHVFVITFTITKVIDQHLWPVSAHNKTGFIKSKSPVEWFSSGHGQYFGNIVVDSLNSKTTIN